MHALKYYKKLETLWKMKKFLCDLYLRPPTFLPGFPRTPWSPFSPRHLQITLQHFLSATVSWKITRNIPFTYTNHKQRLISPCLLFISQKDLQDFSAKCLQYPQTQHSEVHCIQTLCQTLFPKIQSSSVYCPGQPAKVHQDLQHKNKFKLVDIWNIQFNQQYKLE